MARILFCVSKTTASVSKPNCWRSARSGGRTSAWRGCESGRNPLAEASSGAASLVAVRRSSYTFQLVGPLGPTYPQASLHPMERAAPRRSTRRSDRPPLQHRRQTDVMRTVLVDDHALFRDGVASLLLAWGHEVVGQAADGGEAIDLVDETSPDVVLMDVRMPNVSGLEATATIHDRHPEVAIVMLTVSEDEADLFRAIKAGAQGYLLKNLEAPQLRSMLEGVARGEPAITPATAARIIDEFLRTTGPNAQASGLTDRELEVLKLVTAGLR